MTQLQSERICFNSRVFHMRRELVFILKVSLGSLFLFPFNLFCCKLLSWPPSRVPPLGCDGPPGVGQRLQDAAVSFPHPSSQTPRFPFPPLCERLPKERCPSRFARMSPPRNSQVLHFILFCGTFTSCHPVTTSGRSSAPVVLFFTLILRFRLRLFFPPLDAPSTASGHWPLASSFYQSF